MANAARVHAVENGEDLAGYTMIAFGGAAPLHAGRLCEKLAIDRLIVPPGAGVGSAIGFLRAPYAFEATRSVYMRLDAFDEAAAATLLTELASEAETFVRACDATSPIHAKTKLYMRYKGQGWEIPVPLPHGTAPSATTLLALFEEAYTTLFGRTVTGLPVEVTVWAVNAATPVDPPATTPAPAASTSAATTRDRRLFSPVDQAMVTAPEVARAALTDGAEVTGPAVITEAETTIIVPAGFTATGRSDGCIDIRKGAPA